MPGKKFIILIGTLLTTIAVFSFLLSPLFTIRNFKINGLHNLSTESVEQIIESCLNKNIWMINLGRLEKRINEINYIKSVSVSRDYPDSLLVNIQERVPLGKIINNGIVLVFCKEGYILDEGAIGKIAAPLIKGVGYNFIGERLILQSDFAFISEALAAINSQTRNDLNIVAYQEGEISLEMGLNIKAKLGGVEEIIKKFLIVESTLQKSGLLNLEGRIIDLTIIERPVIRHQDL